MRFVATVSETMKALLVSDIHANLVALEAVLDAAPVVDAIWNIGDIVGYGPRPRECLDRLIDLGADPSLVGNHDLACIGELDLAAFNPVAQIASRWTALQLGIDHRAYLKGLPVMTVSAGFALAHGSPRAPIWEYVTSDEIATDNFLFFEEPVCFIGHTHIAMFAALGDEGASARVSGLGDGQVLDLLEARFLVNPGSVGQPRDGDPRAAYAVLDTEQGTVTGYRVEYHVGKTQRQMALVNLPDVLISRLSAGV